ncbi:MAG: hypothetical protein K8R67_11960 [Desulfobacteraceae bacterium]|nr:hypothetical protein [Desulfobacteraceae bacterium]
MSFIWLCLKKIYANKLGKINIINIGKIKNFKQRLFKEFKLLFFDKSINSFIQHNKEIWQGFSNNDSKAEVLFELTGMQPNIISYSYFANVLAKKFSARIKVYSFGENRHLSFFLKRLYKSFSAEVFSYRLNKAQARELRELCDNIYYRINSKDDVYNLKVSEIWFGDLLYDYHLRTYQIPTVDIKDERFKESLKKALYQFIFWRDYFNNHDVKAINISHCCYLIAIPMRIAICYGIPAYQVNAHGCYHMNEKKLWAYTDYYDYPKQFSKLSQNEKSEGLKIAKERIEKRFSGEVGVDMPYSTKSAYTTFKKDRILSDSNKFKILIAAHCFFDSPHGLGYNLFVDFYEWFEFLGSISEKTDYEWYIKTHPDFLSGNLEVLNKFTTKYSKFKMIPSDTSHHQLIEEGIDCALTTYGTIGWEYAALGKLIINASLCNPHIAYNFNIHPKSITEYEKILMALPGQQLDIDINEVYEYYYMKLGRDNMANWLLLDYDSFIEDIGGYKNQFTSISYQRFVATFSHDRHKDALLMLNNFIDSGDYCMQKKHYSN